MFLDCEPALLPQKYWLASYISPDASGNYSALRGKHPFPESLNLPSSIPVGATAGAKYVLEKMSTAMNRGGHAAKHTVLRAKTLRYSQSQLP
jgi:hypothetical protein